MRMENEDSERLAKNKRIKDTLSATRSRRKSMDCRTFSVKIQDNKLNLAQREALKMLFVEAKWFYNSLISFIEDRTHDPSEYDWKTKAVTSLDKDRNPVSHEMEYLSASERQSSVTAVGQALKGLAVLKSHGRNVGSLGYKSEVNQITLKQNGINYDLDFDGNRIRVQGVKGQLRVHGLDQFKDRQTHKLLEGIEFGFARLIQAPSGHYLKVTVFLPHVEKLHNGRSVGIDFGCGTSFATSEGEKINVSVREPERLKRLSAHINRQKLMSGHSKRRYRNIQLLRREYEKMDCRKKDKADKIVHCLLVYDRVVIQDEMLSNWKMTGHGKAVQHSCLGSVKAKLIGQPNVVVLSRSMPTTKLCRECGTIHSEMTLKDRVFKCDCGVEEDRDTHAAENMIWFADHNIGVIQVGAEHIESTRGELKPLVMAAVSCHDQAPTKNREASCSSGKR